MTKSYKILLVLVLVLFMLCAFLSVSMIAHDKIITFLFLFIPGIILLSVGAIIGKKTNKILTGASIGLVLWGISLILAITFIIDATAKYGP